jgi:hypothetical protein
MNLRILFFAVGIVLAAAVLLFVGGFAEIELLTDSGSGSLSQPATADIPDENTPAERRVGLR